MSSIFPVPRGGGGAETTTERLNGILALGLGVSEAISLTGKSLSGTVVTGSLMDGGLTIASDLTMDAFDGSAIVGACSGNFSITGCADLESIDLSNVTTYTGLINFGSNPQLDSIDFTNLTSTTSQLGLGNNTSLLEIVLPNYNTSAGVEASSNTVMTLFSAGFLGTTTGSIDLSNNAALETVNLTSLTFIGDSTQINMANCPALESVDLSNLTSLPISALIDTSNSTLMTTFLVNDLLTIEEFAALNLPGVGLATFSAPSLAVIEGTLNLGGSNITTLSLPVLSAIGDSTNTALIDVSANNSLITVDLSALGAVNPNASLNMSGCTALGSLNITSLSGVYGFVGFSGCTSLVTVSVGASISTTGGFTFNASGCALSTVSVDAILAAFAAGGPNAGLLDLSGGTNAIPTGGTSNPDYITLTGGGTTVNINT